MQQPDPSSSAGSADGSWEERTLELDQVMRRGGPWILWMAFAVIIPHVVIHGLAWPVSAGLFFARLFLFILAYLIGIVVHEGFHVVGMLAFGRVPWKSISFGHRLSDGIVYVHSDESMSARAYRGVLVLPGIMTGLVPAVAGIVIGSFWITFYGWVMLVSAVGDLAVLHLMRGLPPGTRVQDHPSDVGLLILREGAHTGP